jgi:hypothetical protein
MTGMHCSECHINSTKTSKKRSKMHADPIKDLMPKVYIHLFTKPPAIHIKGQKFGEMITGRSIKVVFFMVDQVHQLISRLKVEIKTGIGKLK